MLQKVCRILVEKGGIRAVDSLEEAPSDLDQLIESDKKFGFRTPKNGILKWGLLNNDVELSYNDTKESLSDGFVRWYLHTPIKFLFTKDFNNADIQIIFKSQQQDPLLTGSTIAYAYYPFTGKKIIVFNTAFIFTKHGNAMRGHELKKIGIEVQFPDGGYVTMDLDAILGHELGHFVYGLQHDPENFNLMSANEIVMAEFPTERDIKRAQSKAGKQSFTLRKFQRLFAWLLTSSEH